MKRPVEEENQSKALKTEADGTPSKQIADEEMGEFEDPYGDDFESEDEEIFEAGENGERDNSDAEGEGETAADAMETDEPKKHTSRVFLPHRSAPLGENEVMEADYSTYDMLHSINVKWPCLSFDILPDNLGNDRKIYPQSLYVVTGTQARRPKDNEFAVMKFSSLAKTLIRDDDEDDEDDENDYDADPVLEAKELPTNSTTNRIRLSPFAGTTNEYLAASMMESGDVQILDVTPQMRAFETPGTVVSKQQQKPVHTIKAHGSTEGYAVDWSPLVQTGSLLTGDISGKIFLSSRSASGWTTEKAPFLGTDGSVEELQWSPAEKSVFASGGSDGYIRIWDTRQQARKPVLSTKATTSDVNVMSWNRKAGHLLAAGYDNGQFGVWDLRTFTQGEPVAKFDFHKQAITSIEWNPNDESVLAVGSEDSTVTLWDLSVEADDEEIAEQTKDANGELDDVPSQLLFVHWQPNVKEVHWHKQIPGALVSTGSDGFSLWKTISI